MLLKLPLSLFSVFLALLFFVISTSSAQAYLDAGTGSMLLQLLLGGVAGLAIAGKLYWHRFMVLLRLRSDSDKLEGPEELSRSRASTEK